MAEIKYAIELDPIMWEYPFFRQEMTIDEYNREKEYFGNHYKEYREGNYKSLYEQGKL